MIAVSGLKAALGQLVEQRRDGVQLGLARRANLPGDRQGPSAHVAASILYP
ncbi:MAG: hypothetical protein ICV64_00385 [Thermoleophilia bacterium]|nr:hypothetical protein [Thermoleophilia bacterium]